MRNLWKMLVGFSQHQEEGDWSSRQIVGAIQDFEMASHKLVSLVKDLAEDNFSLRQKIKDSTMNIIPDSMLPNVKMQRIIIHWTAGGPKVNDLDKTHYHFIISQDLLLVKGDHSIADNVNTQDGVYAAHTLNCNTGSIGISLCGMLGAVESPFQSGPNPIQKDQLDMAIKAIAQLATKYGIPVDNKHVLSHAEVQANLGITQRGKWDIAVFPWNPKTYITASKCGDFIRSEVKAIQDAGKD